MALRGAFHDVLGQLSAAERVALRERVALLLSIPPLRAMGANHVSEPIRLLAEVLAERAGRKADDFAVRTLVGAVVGCVCRQCSRSLLIRQRMSCSCLIKAMAQLEAGLPV